MALVRVARHGNRSRQGVILALRALPAAPMRDVLDTLERWFADGRRVATATVVATRRSAPREPGAVLAVNDRGEVAGSVTGGCVEPAVSAGGQARLAGGGPRPPPDGGRGATGV